MKELVLATQNVHKIREIRDILRGLEEIEILTLRQFPDYTPPKETGQDFVENARIKARAAAQALHRWVLADDSGLVVPALQGEPGVRSGRYAGDDATAADNRKKLCQKMEGVTDLQRSASFVCCIALASPEGEIWTEQGTCEGTLLHKERGANGHGYDSLFVKHDYHKTFAELDESTKNRISHRRKALDRIRTRLEVALAATL